MKNLLCFLLASSMFTSVLINKALADASLPMTTADPGTVQKTAPQTQNAPEGKQAEAPVDLEHRPGLTEEELLKKLEEAGKPPKARQISYSKSMDAFKTRIEGNEWQQAFSDRRSFAVWGRNYINRIHCDGIISDVVYPTSKGLELELRNGGHDLFLSVGASVPPQYTHFPADLNLICNGEVFQINGVMDAEYPGTNMELVLAGSVPAESLRPYARAIQRAKSLPHEEKLTKILKRIWNDDPLPYWRVHKKSTICGAVDCRMRAMTETNIDGVKAWDFLVPSALDIPTLLARLSPYTSGELIGLGRVDLRKGQRVIILTTTAEVDK